LGGSLGRDAATGRGVVIVIEEAARTLALPLEGATAAIQGFGNVGSWAARIFHDLGCRIVAVSNAAGAIRSDAGIDPHKLYAHTAGGGDLAGFEGVDPISADELLSTPCEVFVPAALGGMIHQENADLLDCRMIIEGANSPTTPAADEILSGKGVFVVPDVLANAGGVVVSYFEWVQNLQHFRWDEAEVNERLGRIMRRAYGEVAQRAEADQVPLRIAAYELGIERVLDAARTRGYISDGAGN
ncbi:MAG TPA: glutamate dehydrogenase, partial [Thermoleophilaceae bacterium]|nr:glutamate dehydrogenase [Thermoleophilaceae bacterium]